MLRRLLRVLRRLLLSAPLEACHVRDVDHIDKEKQRCGMSDWIMATETVSRAKLALAGVRLCHGWVSLLYGLRLPTHVARNGCGDDVGLTASCICGSEARALQPLFFPP